MNVFAVGNPFVFFVYMAYTLPWIVLGFYLYPIKILVRVSAILMAALCITFVILRYFEKCVENLKPICKKKCKCLYCERCDNEPTDQDNWELLCNVISAATKCVAGVLVLVCIGFIGYLLHHIIFVLTLTY